MKTVYCLVQELLQLLIQNFMFQLLLLKLKTMQNYQNYEACDLKDEFTVISVTASAIDAGIKKNT